MPILNNWKVRHLLISLAAILIIATATIINLNPSKKIKQYRNEQRQDDIKVIVNLIELYSIDHNGKLPESIPGAETIIGSKTGQSNICPNLVPTYSSLLPFDEKMPGTYFNNCTDYNLGYTIKKDASNKIVVRAPSSELGDLIEKKQ